ncbi:MAG: hypothetical protein K8S55_04150 [Phycisphaerae bacterium]|nr:hypothetical protein [Phycisphaerae bacterium]
MFCVRVPLKISMWVLLPVLVLAAGCELTEKPPQLNIYRNDRGIKHVSRVVFVQLADDVGYPAIAQRMTETLCDTMQRQGRFHVDIVPATHSDLRDLDMIKREPYTIAELISIRKSLRCDAILFGRMSSYRPYPGTQIGLFLRLVDLKDGELIWAVDDVWDTTDRKVAKRIKRFYFDEMRDTYDPAKAEMGIMSTSGFQKFVSYEIVETMKPTSKTKSRTKYFFERPMRKFGRHQKQFWHNAREDL